MRSVMFEKDFLCCPECSKFFTEAELDGYRFQESRYGDDHDWVECPKCNIGQAISKWDHVTMWTQFTGGAYANKA